MRDGAWTGRVRSFGGLRAVNGAHRVNALVLAGIARHFWVRVEK
jgi:hypothetical protein